MVYNKSDVSGNSCKSDVALITIYHTCCERIVNIFAVTLLIQVFSNLSSFSLSYQVILVAFD